MECKAKHKPKNYRVLRKTSIIEIAYKIKDTIHKWFFLQKPELGVWAILSILILPCMDGRLLQHATQKDLSFLHWSI